MTSLFPHPPYAEDQPNARTILYLHVTRASAMTFSFLSIPLTGLSLLATRLRKQPLSTRYALSRLLLNSGRGLVLGAIAGPVMTWGRMRSMEEVEWQDRSWRLLENRGEVRTDWETVGAAGVGAVAGVAHGFALVQARPAGLALPELRHGVHGGDAASRELLRQPC